MKNLTTIVNLSRLSIILVALVGVIAGILFANHREQTNPYSQHPLSHANNSTLLLAEELPQDVESLVNTSEVIVRGQIVGIADERILYGYDVDEAEMAKFDQQYRPNLGIPIVDYVIAIDEILLGYSLLQEQTTLIYRVPKAQHLEVGQQKLLFLSPTPDGKAFGVNSIIHDMLIEGTSIVHLNLENGFSSPFNYRTSTEFLDDVRTTVAQLKSSR